jgi:hypothetical protein
MKAIVDPFDNLQSKEPDKQENVESDLDEKVQKTYGLYSKDGYDINFGYFQELRRLLKSFRLETLTPAQINHFLQKIKETAYESRLQNGATGYFFSRLITLSYLSGHDQFVLDTGDTKIDNLCYLLMARKDNPIKVIVNGNVGTFFGGGSKFCDYVVNGDSLDNFFGESSYNCRYEVNNVTRGCGSDSKNSFYKIKGNAGPGFAADAEDCVFDIDGKVQISPFELNGQPTAKNCKFIANAAYETLKNWFHGVNGCEVVQK